MPLVKPYSPTGTGTLADVLERGPELGQVRPAGPDSFAPPPSWGDLFRAARPAALQATPGYDDTKIGEGYAPIVDALGLPASENPGYYGELDPAGEARVGSVGSPSQLATDAQVGELVPFSNRRLADRAIQESLLVQQIKARRAKDPGALPGIPDTVDGLHDYFEKQQAAKRQAGAAVLARGGAWSRLSAGFAAGGVESAINDPTFLPSMIFGGGSAETFLQAVGRDALINGVLTAGQQPMLAHNMAEGGEHLSLGEAIGNTVEGAAVGAVLGGTIHLGATHIPPALFQVMPETVQRRWADRMRVGENGPLLKDVIGDMDNRELSAFARTTLGPRMTPDESAAANVLERAQEVGESSPFMPGPVGDAAHRASIAEGLKSILDGAPEPAPSRGALLSSSSLTAAPTTTARPLSIGVARVPSDIVSFFKSKGATDGQAYGIAAGITAESGGDHTAVNRSSGALGLGQWLGPRKAALVGRYGESPSRVDQLEYLWHELTGGDRGGAAVLAEKDPGRVLDAYIRKFMRPAAGAETTGDLERGMAALGHRGELPEGSGGAALTAGDDDLVGQLQRDADAADREALELAGGRDRENSDLAPSRGAPDPTEVPILKRELFPSDAAWAEAQVAFHQQLMGDDAPQSPGNAPPAREMAGDGAEVPETPGGAESAPEAADPVRSPAQQRALLADLLERIEGPGHYAASEDYARHVLRRNDFLFDLAGGDPRPEFAGRNERRQAELRQALSDERFSELRTVAKRHFGATNGLTRKQNLAHLSAVTDADLAAVKSYDLEQMKAQSVARATELAHEGNVPAQRFLASKGMWPEVRIDDPALKATDEIAGRAELVDSLEHDYRMAAQDPALADRSYLIDDSGKPQKMSEILEQLDADAAAAKALRACAMGGAA